MLHENPNFKSLRLDGDHDAATGAKSRESSVEKNRKLRKSARRMWANSTLSKALQDAFRGLRVCAEAAGAIATAVNNHSLSHLVHQRRHLKETFHMLQEKEKESLRFLADAKASHRKTEKELHEAEQISMSIAENLRVATQLPAISDLIWPDTVAGPSPAWLRCHRAVAGVV